MSSGWSSCRKSAAKGGCWRFSFCWMQWHTGKLHFLHLLLFVIRYNSKVWLVFNCRRPQSWKPPVRLHAPEGRERSATIIYFYSNLIGRNPHRGTKIVWFIRWSLWFNSSETWQNIILKDFNLMWSRFCWRDASPPRLCSFSSQTRANLWRGQRAPLPSLPVGGWRWVCWVCSFWVLLYSGSWEICINKQSAEVMSDGSRLHLCGCCTGNHLRRLVTW